MSRSLTNLRAVGTHAGGGGLPAVVFGATGTSTLDQYINDAGIFLCQMRAWKFLERNPLALDFTISQAYIVLPTDLGQVLSVVGANNVANPFRLTTIAEVMLLRTSLITNTMGQYVGAVDHPTQVSQVAAPPAPRLELYPTPGATQSAALSMQYRAGWVTLTGATDVANIPARFDALLDECVRAFVIGKARNNLADMLSALLLSPLVAQLERYESVEQSEYGVPTHGALTSSGDETSYPQMYQSTVVSGP